MGERANIRLNGAACHRPTREIDSVYATIDSRHILRDGKTRCVVRVLDQLHASGHDLLESSCCLIDRVRVGGTAGVLETDRVNLDVTALMTLQQPLSDADVE